MSSDSKTTDLSADELDRLIRHLRKQDGSFVETFAGFRRVVKSDHAICADYLEAMRSELPNWQKKEGEDVR